jgi:hypothetical protein
MKSSCMLSFKTVALFVLKISHEHYICGVAERQRGNTAYITFSKSSRSKNERRAYKKIKVKLYIS